MFSSLLFLPFTALFPLWILPGYPLCPTLHPQTLSICTVFIVRPCQKSAGQLWNAAALARAAGPGNYEYDRSTQAGKWQDILSKMTKVKVCF